jgi:hypothetical protein
VRRLAILSGLCLIMTGAAASGAPRSSKSPTSALNGHALRASAKRRTHGHRASPLVLLGERAVESRVDHPSVGTVEAFAFRARRSGTAASISVYLDARDRATNVIAGVYSSRHGRPQSLLTLGLLRFPKAGAWNSVVVPPATLNSGRSYWIAVLGKGGAVYFRDRNGGLCTSAKLSRRSRVRSLPRIWAGGRTSHACHISAYVKAAGAKVLGTNAPGGTTTTAGGTATPNPTAPPAVNSFCSIAAAYTDLTTGPHLCGWPDSTNTGYVNAPGYPGGLTAASSGSSACPTVPQSNHTYEFCDYVGGLNLPAGLANVTFYGDEFYSTNPNEANVAGGRGDNNLTFAYDTFQPEQASPPVTCAESYVYGISNEGGEIGKLTVEHSNFWGFAAAVDTEGSTQANPQVMSYNWIHDASAASGCGYHPDGIGMLGGGTEEYAIVDHNTIEFTADTNGANLIAWQNGTYAHDQNTNNLLSGDGEGYAGGRCTSSCTQPSYITSTGNTYSTYLQASSGEGPIDGASNFWSGTGDVWNHNYWAVPPRAFWGTPAYNGYYWVPTGNSSNPQDCGFISKTDYPNYSNPCPR